MLTKGVLKINKLSIDLYFMKTSYASYRFKDRMKRLHPIQPPNEFGLEDHYEQSKLIDNPLILKSMGFKQSNEHPENENFKNEYSLNGSPIGRIYERYPFKYRVEKDKVYLWCSCGYGHNQPFCDLTHKQLWTSLIKKSHEKYRPIKYIANETKDIWFCNCKQTSQRPICDGTCKTLPKQDEQRRL
jgi:CDGSH iron-sulfur domain-containing protein 3